MKPKYIAHQGMVIDGNIWQVHPQTGEPWNDDSVRHFMQDHLHNESTISLHQAKQQAIKEIKRLAADRISALDWQLQRAEERLSQAELSGESSLIEAEEQLLEILDAREAIRQQSNDAEDRLIELKHLEAVMQFSW